MNNLLQLLFWLSAAALTYTFVGYAALSRALARLSNQSRPDTSPALRVAPTVTVVLAVHNEQSRIADRIKNLLASDYPAESLSIVLASDGSTDNTIAEIARIPSGRVQLLPSALRMGKAACLNRAARQVRSEVIVFADARQSFESDTIARLSGWFDDPRIGAVSGNLTIAAAHSSAGQGVDFYWKLEKSLRCWESDFDSSIGCTGAVYAIRSSLFEELPEDCLVDDLVIPMRIAMRGYRIAFDPHAHAFDPQAPEPGRERLRKRRTLAGNLQTLFRYPEWILPWRNRLWWQLVSHKYLRLFSPIFLLVTLLTSALLYQQSTYRTLLAFQAFCYTAGIAGLLLPVAKPVWLAIPSGFLFLNLTVVNAWWEFLFGPKKAGWTVPDGVCRTAQGSELHL